MKLAPIHKRTVERLLKSDEPSIVYKTRSSILREDDSRLVKKLKEEVRKSTRVQQLLQNRDINGKMRVRRNVYDKWQGAHWVLASLADLGYPAGDESLFQIRDDVLEFWLDERYYREFVVTSKRNVYQESGVPIIQDRFRRCASQQGNALYFLSKLGLGDHRLEQLVERLLHWQWDDGGWNCDKSPDADTSSFMETILPLRGLSLYGRETQNLNAIRSSKRAAEVFLKRRLLWRISDGKVIDKDFCKLHYPVYWHYDFLHGLKVLAESGFIGDHRCVDALDLLERMQLKDGGWAAEARYYKAPSVDFALNADYVDWGGTSKRQMNEWVTADALYVLGAAQRLNVN